MIFTTSKLLLFVFIFQNAYSICFNKINNNDLLRFLVFNTNYKMIKSISKKQNMIILRERAVSKLYDVYVKYYSLSDEEIQILEQTIGLFIPY